MVRRVKRRRNPLPTSAHVSRRHARERTPSEVERTAIGTAILARMRGLVAAGPYLTLGLAATFRFAYL